MKKTPPSITGPLLALLVTAAGCSDPCEEYCEVGIDRIDECGVASVGDREREIEACADLLDDADADVCDRTRESIESASCDQIAAIYCPNTPPSAAGPACSGP